jgi:DNA ligase-1
MKYSELCEMYEDLEKNPSRLKKIEILTKFLKKFKKEKNREVIYLIQGRVFPDYNKAELGVSSQLIKKAIAKSTGTEEAEITRLWKKLGDLGSVAEELVKKKKQRTLTSRTLTAEKVLENLRKLTEFTGAGTVGKKISLVSELLTSAKPLEARYIVRTILSDLRIGTGTSTIRDAIVEACLEKSKENSELIQEAYDKSTDFALVFEKACRGKKFLGEMGLEPGKPVKVMLFQKEETIEDGFKRVGKPCLVDYKYDGFRMMINKDEKGDIKIFTRRLEEVTKQFPEVVNYVKRYVRGKSFILDSEAVGFDPKTKKYQPFQSISQRIRRKYHIERLEKELPIEINVFDILYYNGKSLLKTPFKERRKLIEKIVKNQKYKIRTSKAIITSSSKEVEKFYREAVQEGEEGIMMKNLEAGYKPGSRVGYGIKIKPEENEFDLVIIGAEYGTGKRAGWLTSFDIACKEGNKFLGIGKVSTGLKEKEEQGLSYKEMTKKLKKIITKSKGRHVEVKPELVVTVTYQNIQKSPKYPSGYALRFPRFTRLRPDRKADDIATLGEIKKEYGK